MAMLPLGPPPGDLDRRRLSLADVPGRRLFRIHPAAMEALHFSRGRDNRFDDPGIPPSFGVLYAGTSVEAAFAEVLGRGSGPVVLDEGDLASRSIACLVLRRRLRLADVTGPNARRVGATGEISTCAYAVSRQWAAAIHAHPDRADGILYVGRHDNSTCGVALFDRAADAIGGVDDLGTLMSDPRRLAALLDRYGFGLA